MYCNVLYYYSLSNVAKLAAHSKFVWVFNANCDGTIIYNDSVDSNFHIIVLERFDVFNFEC
jgi:hypothetical protein